MKFLSMIRITENAGQQPSERLMTEMGKLIEEMRGNGSLVSTAGLQPTKDGKRVRSRHGTITVTDGPFVETKEVIGGYAMLEAKSMDEAIALTRRFLAVHGDEWDLECEVRALAGPSSAPARRRSPAMDSKTRGSYGWVVVAVGGLMGCMAVGAMFSLASSCSR